MAIEVRELVVRANVQSEKAGEKGSGKDSGPGLGKIKTEIIEECMAKIRDALAAQKRR